MCLIETGTKLESGKLILSFFCSTNRANLKIMKKRFYFLLVAAVVIVAAIYALLYMYSQQEQSTEGKILVQACEDIQAYNTFEAEYEIDSLINVIMKHRFPSGSGSNWTEADAIIELREIKDQISFQNKDEAMYHQHFAAVLNKLALAHLQDAKAYLEKDSKAAAKASIREACHLLHDALHFSQESMAKEQLDLLKKLRMMTEENVNMKEVEECLQMNMELI